ncbi:LLM class flavin-dependent oxidoreductase [Bradyrhizobium sp. CCGUVB4N]|uniref:LLM class flavin-dependent oxidoreductase n=1 Tax=Bradyrhizobium sp. CCGUVB4N TaxID=2949631 RepID=UPI0020B20651|nr:LLM class flavin-dependent oxidoreductase [Bradyrhizobium sp. CCGUVB4N]MCP3380507.1 LLM class flavin-dependent oxidoreductase [Bradyrhizobium sp. CCGUVB4N]
MKFGVFYEHQLPQPWENGGEKELFDNALEQIELADQLGFDYMWQVEHHFLEEYSHSSAPEVFLGAVSQRTKNIRVGHGICLSPPHYNHPARVAERLATLDLISGGRVEWGTGESASLIEMHGFGIEPELKSAMWREGVEQTANMMTMRPYPGYEGRFFKMPSRNIVPKPIQKPHPPLWMACSRRDSILRAARYGVGALVFGFVEASQAKLWRDEYYETIKSDECVPIGHSVNANIATLNGMMVHDSAEEAMRRGIDGFKFFGYSIAHYAIYGEHRPGRTNLWRRFQAVKDDIKETPGSGSIGRPQSVRDHLMSYADVGIDQMIFIQQCGLNKHEHICEALELFAKEVMPALKEREDERVRRKEEELAPYVAAALARKPLMPELRETDIPNIEAMGIVLERRTGKDYASAGGPFADPTRGGAIPMVSRETYAKAAKVD